MMRTATPGWSFQYWRTLATIWRRAGSEVWATSRRRSLPRSMQERTWARDLAPSLQIAVTNASVDGMRTSVTPCSVANS